MFRPVFIPKYIKKHLRDTNWFSQNADIIKRRLVALRGDTNQPPDVSVVVPAYNEENSILRTISSLSETKTNKTVEVLVVDNNSTDKTKEYILAAGAEYLFEQEPGVKNARNAGLRFTKAKYVISADADTVYSPFWVDCMIDPLIKNVNIACAHGRFSFIPEPGYNRAEFFVYEIIGDVFKKVNGWFKDKAMYVYGCSSAYRAEQAIAVDGYDHPAYANEDGYLGLKLRNRFGKLFQVTDLKSLAWTSSRRLITDGTLTNRVRKKVKALRGKSDLK